jgi:hypothetical protein
MMMNDEPTNNFINSCFGPTEFSILLVSSDSPFVSRLQLRGGEGYAVDNDHHDNAGVWPINNGHDEDDRAHSWPSVRMQCEAKQRHFIRVVGQRTVHLALKTGEKYSVRAGIYLFKVAGRW